MNGEIENYYEASAELNMRSSLILKQFGLLNESDTVVLSANYYKPVKIEPKILNMHYDINHLQN